jgi:CheY-like chemotaxis protein
MDGYEATRRLKSTEAGRAASVIAITASAFDDSRKQVMAAGMNAYLRKPFRREELYAVLGESLGLRYVFADAADKAPGQPPKTPPLTPESLAGLPRELIRAMDQAVAEGDMTRLMGLIARVEKIDSRVARGLRALANRFEYEKLGQVLA